jgi:hypothetical protein
MRATIDIYMAHHFGTLTWFQPGLIHDSAPILDEASAQFLIFRQAEQKSLDTLVHLFPPVEKAHNCLRQSLQWYGNEQCKD